MLLINQIDTKHFGQKTLITVTIKVKPHGDMYVPGCWMNAKDEILIMMDNRILIVVSLEFLKMKRG